MITLEDNTKTKGDRVLISYQQFTHNATQYIQSAVCYIVYLSGDTVPVESTILFKTPLIPNQN